MKNIFNIFSHSDFEYNEVIDVLNDMVIGLLPSVLCEVIINIVSGTCDDVLTDADANGNFLTRAIIDLGLPMMAP